MVLRDILAVPLSAGFVPQSPGVGNGLSPYPAIGVLPPSPLPATCDSRSTRLDSLHFAFSVTSFKSPFAKKANPA